MSKRYDFDKPFDNVKELKTYINSRHGKDIFDSYTLKLITRWKNSDVEIPTLVFYTLGYTEYWSYQYDEDTETLTLWITSHNVKK